MLDKAQPHGQLVIILTLMGLLEDYQIILVGFVINLNFDSIITMAEYGINLLWLGAKD